MAFSKSPTVDTRSSVTIPAVTNLDFFTPSNFFGQGLINMLPYKSAPDDTADEMYAVTRPGISILANVLAAAGVVCRGLYVWEKSVGTIYYFVVIDQGGTSTVYSSVNGTAWALVNTLAVGGTTPVRFAEFIDSTNTKKLVMVDGTNGYVFTSNAAGTQIVDVDFPTPHVPWPVFLDGRLFLAKANTGDIYNSDLNDPAVWTAGSFISTELYPDDIQALLKVKNYILAVGTQSGEYFYDAGNSIGTPLAKYDGATLPFGTSFPNAIATDRDTIMMLASGSSGSGTSLRLIDGFDHKVVESQGPFIMQGANLDSNGCRAGFFRVRGEQYYMLQVSGGNQSAPTSQHTYIYNPRYKLWTAAIVTDVRAGYASTAQYQWPVYYLHSGTSTNAIKTYIAGHIKDTVFFGTLDDTIGYDDLSGISFFGADINIHQQCILPYNDFGTGNRKTMSKLFVNYFRPNENTNYNPVIVTMIDDGYTSIDAQLNLQPIAGWGSPTNYTVGAYPVLYQLGQFRRREIALAIPGGVCKLYGVIADINKGAA